MAVLLVLAASAAGAQTEEELDRELLGGDTSSEVQEKINPWEINGFLRSSLQLALPFSDDASEYEVVKLEGRGRLNTQYSSGTFSAKVTVDAFYYPLKLFKDTTQRNRIEAAELYVAGGDRFQFKLGIQRFAWGNAEIFGVTGFFNRLDLSESLAKDPADITRGVAALSLKYIFGELAIEAAWCPMHYPVIVPRGFWALKDHKPYETEFIYNDSIRYDMTKSSAGARVGGTLQGFDAFVSYFNGYSSNVLINSTMIETGSLTAGDIDYDAVKRESRLEYMRVNSIGLELSRVIKKVTLRYESVVTPDMGAMKKVTDDDVDDVILAMSNDASDGELSSMSRVPYFAYTLGADWNIWGPSGMILLEWTQGLYLRNMTDYNYPALSYLMVIFLQDSFFDKRLTVRGGTVFRPIAVLPGGLLSGEVAWKFRQNCELAFRGMFFFGNDDDLFEYFKNKDIIEVRMSYLF